jgi:3-dehydroquinate synthase class II
MFGSLVVLSLVAAGVMGADEAKGKSAKDQKHDKATITKVDAKKGTLVVTTKDANGKDVEKTLQLAEGAKFIGSDGKAAKIDLFQSGDHVRMVENDGKITELKRCSDRIHATIGKVDAAESKVAVTMKDPEGKEVEKTIKLASGAKLFDNNGKAAGIDTFKKGDHVLLTEKDGLVTEMKQGVEHSKAKITKVDSDKGTVSAMVKDRNGNDAERLFFLTDDIEYIDSTGEIATIEVFESGDEVLIFESEGKIKELNKDETPKKSADKKVSTK